MKQLNYFIDLKNRNNVIITFSDMINPPSSPRTSLPTLTNYPRGKKLKSRDDFSFHPLLLEF